MASAKRVPGITVSGRGAILDRITEPLGFFVLVVLIIEALIGTVASFSDQTSRTQLTIYMLILLGSVIVGVFILAFFRPETVGLRSATVILSFPQTLSRLDITRISWISSKCFINYSNKRDNITPALSPVAPSFEITLSSRILAQLRGQPLDIELTDENGLIWVVKPFHVHQRPVMLVCKGDLERVQKLYGDIQ
jgi:hypothetical protein